MIALLFALTCPLTVTATADIYLIAIYAHEASPGVRYVYQTAPMTIHPGEVANPCPCEGYPIGFEWHWVVPEFEKASTLVKSCGDTSRVYPKIFADGFESGGTERWNQ